MNTKFNSNSHGHDKIDNRDGVQLDIQNCHHALQNIILSAGGIKQTTPPFQRMRLRDN